MRHAARARVVFLVADLDLGGIQSMVASLARGIDRDRFAPAALCLDGLGRLADDLRGEGMEVRLVQRRPGVDWRLGRRLERELLQLGAAVVHAHNRTALFYGVLARGLGAPWKLLYTEHDRSFPERLRVRALHRVLARRLDAVTCVCGAVRDAVVATEGFPAGKVRVVWNGVADPPDRPGVEEAREAVRAEFGADGQALIVAVGHLTEVKDHAFLLRALHRVAAAGRPLLVIAGDGPLRADLAAQSAALGLDLWVRMPGYRRDVDRLLKGADALVMSSRSEGLSVALVEACARGVPIVATRVGGNPEVVEHGVNGLLVEHGDEAGLAAALHAIAADPALRARLGAGGHARFAARFRLSSMIAAYEDLYAGLAGAGV